MHKILIVITCITIVGGIFRFYKLGEIPAGFHRDEAFLAYNAFSLLKNGTDMSGKPFPLHFESYLYSPGGYSYASVPFIWLFGLSTFSARFASAFFGTATLPLVFLFTKKIFEQKKYASTIAILTQLIISVLPWHINLSRTATENVLVVFFITLGFYLLLFMRNFRSKNRTITYHVCLRIIAYCSFFISLTLYQAPRAFLPMLLPFFLLYEYKKNKNIRLSFISFCLFLLCIVLPVLFVLTSPTLSTRMKTVSIFSTERTQLIIDEQIRNAGTLHVHPLLSRIMHNKVIGYTNAFVNNLFAHISFSFLFTDNGLPDRYRVPYSGLLFTSYLPLLIIGTYWLFRNNKTIFTFLMTWILMGFIGSAFTFDDIPNLQRTLIIFPALAIVIAGGIIELLSNKKTSLIILVFLITIFIEATQYTYNYYIQQLVYRPWYRQEGYQKLVEATNTLKDNYTSIVVTNKESAPAIFYLFFNAYNPKIYIAETKNSELKDLDRVGFSSYTFSQEECPFKEIETIDQKTLKPKTECYGEKNVLYVNAGVCKLPTVCGKVLSNIERNDGTRVFSILEVQ